MAEKVFVEQGYGAASMDEIAQDAGMSKKTLYQLFDTKEALFAAVITDRMLALGEGRSRRRRPCPSKRRSSTIFAKPAVSSCHRAMWRSCAC
ncbi:TetR/AcrR family transcriptional regulator [Hypericibacter adhaerens]|uniref:TetR/AcrR family transcriptional regulator n=1 Tax=Hypericibacter adhaerens TaxID=2602016 RepID=UPI00177CCD1D|nr:helix-turn-helix domain-containing protein [Hypericibacter adhaerens]